MKLTPLRNPNSVTERMRMQGLLSPPSQAQLSGELLKENQELRAKLEELEEQLAKYDEYHQRLTKEAEAADAYAVKVLADKDRELLDMKIFAFDHKYERERLHKLYTSLEAEKQAADGQLAELRNRLEVLQHDQQRQQSQISTLEAKLSEERQKLHTEMQELQEQRKKLDAMETTMSGELERVKDTKCKLLIRETQQNEFTTRMEAQAEEAEKRMAWVQAAEASLATKAAVQEEKELALVAMLDTLKVQQAQLDAERTLLEKNAIANQEMAEKLQMNGNEAKMVTESNRQQTRLLEERFMEYNIRLKELRELEAKLDAESKEVTAQRRDLSAERQELLNRRHEVQRRELDLEAAAKRFTDTEQKIFQEQVKCNELRSELEEKAGAISADLACLQSTRCELENQRILLEQQRHDLDTRSKQLQQEEVDLKARKDSTECLFHEVTNIRAELEKREAGAVSLAAAAEAREAAAQTATMAAEAAMLEAQQRVTKCNEVDALLLVEKERLDVLAKKLNADLEDSIARKHALDELEVVLKELESKVSGEAKMLERQRTELKNEADDLAHREARLRPQEDELKGRKVTLDVRERDLADQFKDISKKIKMVEDGELLLHKREMALQKREELHQESVAKDKIGRVELEALNAHVAACTAKKDAVVAELASVQGHLQEREVERHRLESELLKLKEELLQTQAIITTQQRAADALVIPAEHPSVANETASHDNQLPAVEEHRLAAAEEELALLREEVEQLRMSVTRLVAERSVATERLQSLEQELAAVRASTSPIRDATGRLIPMQPARKEAPGSGTAVVAAPPHVGGCAASGCVADGRLLAGSSPMDLAQTVGAALAEDENPSMSKDTPVSSSRATSSHRIGGGAVRSTIASAARAAGTRGRVRGRGRGRGAGKGDTPATSSRQVEAAAMTTSSCDAALEPIKETKEAHHGLPSQLQGGSLVAVAGHSTGLSRPPRSTRSRGSHDSKSERQAPVADTTATAETGVRPIRITRASSRIAVGQVKAGVKAAANIPLPSDSDELRTTRSHASGRTTRSRVPSGDVEVNQRTAAGMESMKRDREPDNEKETMTKRRKSGSGKHVGILDN